MLTKFIIQNLMVLLLIGGLVDLALATAASVNQKLDSSDDDETDDDETDDDETDDDETDDGETVEEIQAKKAEIAEEDGELLSDQLSSQEGLEGLTSEGNRISFSLQLDEGSGNSNTKSHDSSINVYLKKGAYHGAFEYDRSVQYTDDNLAGDSVTGDVLLERTLTANELVFAFSQIHFERSPFSNIDHKSFFGMGGGSTVWNGARVVLKLRASRGQLHIITSGGDGFDEKRFTNLFAAMFHWKIAKIANLSMTANLIYPDASDDFFGNAKSQLDFDVSKNLSFGFNHTYKYHHRPFSTLDDDGELKSPEKIDRDISLQITLNFGSEE